MGWRTPYGRTAVERVLIPNLAVMYKQPTYTFDMPQADPVAATSSGSISSTTPTTRC